MATIKKLCNDARTSAGHDEEKGKRERKQTADRKAKEGATDAISPTRRRDEPGH